jgi:ankyrin repeat protein
MHNLQNKDIQERLINAIRRGNLGVVNKSIKNGANVNPQISSNSAQWSDEWPLYTAILFNRIEVAQDLIKNGANVNHAKNGKNILLEWIDSRIKKAIKKGVNVQRGAVVLFKDIEQSLRDAGARYQNIPKDYTPLSQAVKDGQQDIAQELLDGGCNPNIYGGNGWSPLCLAVKNNSLSMVNLLLSKGAKANMPAKDHLTPLYLAFNNEFCDIFKQLLESEDEISNIDILQKLHQDLVQKSTQKTDNSTNQEDNIISNLLEQKIANLQSNPIQPPESKEARSNKSADHYIFNPSGLVSKPQLTNALGKSHSNTPGSIGIT